MSIQQIVNQLIEGNDRFITGKISNRRCGRLQRIALVENQSPFAVILSCADSRVVPELIFDVGLGELFVVRVIGNIANAASIASIEYAITNLNTKLIVVLGHQNCGAVSAAIDGYHDSVNIMQVINHIAPAVKLQKTKNNLNKISKLNAVYTALELTKNSKIIKNATDSEKIRILPAFYHLDSGKVKFLENIN